MRGATKKEAMKTEGLKPVNSPIKWAGGKSRLRKFIVALIPEDHDCYVEPFGGAAWVLFAKPRSKVEVYNDIYGELVNFFRVIQQKPLEFIASFKWTLVSRQIFNELKAADPRTLTDVERAHRFFYLIMAAWGGESKEEYLRFQTSISDGGHGNRLIGALKHLEKRIWPVYERLRTVIIENLDWKQVVNIYDSPRTVFYFDPPYPGNGVNYEHNMRSWEAHEELLSALTNIRGKWILSTYKSQEKKVKAIIPESHIWPVSAYSGMRKSKKKTDRVLNEEILVTNYEAPQEFLELLKANAANKDKVFLHAPLFEAQTC